jgi:glycosyltransferase involved in cell wall biosynthesis
MSTVPPAAPSAAPSPPPAVSVVVPVCNEEGAAGPLAQEIAAAFEGAGLTYEMIFVDDASRDATRERLCALKTAFPALRLIAHETNAGQSRAVRTGAAAARAAVIVTLDGDGQNDPADAPGLARRLMQGPADLGLVGGRRLKRQDSAAKRWASRLANGVRKRLLRDGADDTGCGIKAFRRDAFLALPYFDHMHRYLPALMLRDGWAVAFQDVNHRPRTTGASKYGNLDRFLASLSDLAGVMWLQTRARRPGQAREL